MTALTITIGSLYNKRPVFPLDITSTEGLILMFSKGNCVSLKSRSTLIVSYC